MKTSGSDETEIELQDKTKYTARIFFAKEYPADPSLNKKGRMSLGFNIRVGSGEATRWGSWGVDYGWVKKMFKDAFGDDPSEEDMKGEVVEVTLKTRDGYDQEVAGFTPTTEVFPREGAQKKGQSSKPAAEDDAW